MAFYQILKNIKQNTYSFLTVRVFFMWEFWKCLDFAKFRLKRVNRPTSEAQPQKKRGNRKPKLVLLEGG